MEYINYESRLDYQARIVTEQKELGDRIFKLNEFILFSSIFRELSMDEQTRIKVQEFHMMKYWRILGDRIAAFPKLKLED